MTISVGDTFPNVELKVMGKEGPEPVTTDSLLAGKKIVLFAVPGAFTPACDATHLPGFVVNVDDIKAKGVDAVACVAVNDIFVMDAWGKSQNAEHLMMLADGNGDLAKALGLELDITAAGLGVRSKRYAMIINDKKVEYFGLDAKGVEKSSAEAVLEAL